MIIIKDIINIGIVLILVGVFIVVGMSMSFKTAKAQLFESVLKTESLGQDKTRFCRMRDNFGTYTSFDEYLECQSYMFQIINEKI